MYVSFRRPSGIDKEFLVQLFVEPVKGISVVHTQDLLTNMFLDQSISFVKVSIKVSSVYVLISFSSTHQDYCYKCLDMVKDLSHFNVLFLHWNWTLKNYVKSVS